MFTKKCVQKQHLAATAVMIHRHLMKRITLSHLRNRSCCNSTSLRQRSSRLLSLNTYITQKSDNFFADGHTPLHNGLHGAVPGSLRSGHTHSHAPTRPDQAFISGPESEVLLEVEQLSVQRHVDLQRASGRRGLCGYHTHG